MREGVICCGARLRFCKSARLVSRAGFSKLAAVVGPVQQSLALPRPTCGVTGLAVPPDLCDVSLLAFHRLIWRASSSGMRGPM